MVRKGYTPTPYHRKGRRGEHIPLHQRAEEAAKYLEQVQSGGTEEPRGNLRQDKVITQEVHIKTSDIEQEEVEAAIKKLQNYKCGGPPRDYSKH